MKSGDWGVSGGEEKDEGEEREGLLK